MKNLIAIVLLVATLCVIGIGCGDTKPKSPAADKDKAAEKDKK